MYESRRPVCASLLQLKKRVAAYLEVREWPTSGIAKSKCFFKSKRSSIELDPFIKVGNADRNMIHLQRLPCYLSTAGSNRQSEHKTRSKQCESTHESSSYLRFL